MGELGKMPEHHFSISFGDARGIINAPKVPVAPTKTHEKISNLRYLIHTNPKKNYSNKFILLLFCFRQTEGCRGLSPMRISPEEEEDATCCFPYTRNEFFLHLWPSAKGDINHAGDNNSWCPIRLCILHTHPLFGQEWDWDDLLIVGAHTSGWQRRRHPEEEKEKEERKEKGEESSLETFQHSELRRRPGEDTTPRSRQNSRGGKICCENRRRRRRKLNADFCHGGDWASKDLFWKRRRRVNKVKWKTFVGGKEGNHGEHWKIGILVIILLGEHLGNLEWMSDSLKWKLFVFRTSNPTKGQTFFPTNNKATLLQWKPWLPNFCTFTAIVFI